VHDSSRLRSFLLTTHYARYDLQPALFTINFVSLLFFALAPKLPSLHRIRLRFFSADDGADPISLHASRSLQNVHSAASSRKASPQPTLNVNQRLTDANLKALDATQIRHGSPPTPILEESEPRTPFIRTPTPSPRKWKFS
jgi:hypothetical protein